MTKKVFKALIENNISIFKCIVCNDYAVSSKTKRYYIAVKWLDKFDHTIVHEGLNNLDSTRSTREFNKYKRWLDEVVEKGE